MRKFDHVYELPWVIYWLVMWTVIAGCIVAAFFIDGVGAAAGPIAGLIMWTLFGVGAYFALFRED